MTPPTVDEYTNTTGVTVTDADATQRLLASASRLIDWAVGTSMYDPDDEATQATLREAACVQAAYMEDTGDTTGTAALFNGGSLGPLTLNGATRAVGDGGPAARISPDAWLILDTAGLLSTKVSG